jgi:hypothetical protein
VNKKILLADEQKASAFKKKEKQISWLETHHDNNMNR